MALVCHSVADHTQLHQLQPFRFRVRVRPYKGRESLYQLTEHSGLIPDHCHGEEMGERSPSYDVDRAAQ